MFPPGRFAAIRPPGRDAGVGLLRVLAAVGFAVGPEAGVEHDEMMVAGVERIERRLQTDAARHLLLGQQFDALVAKDVLPFLRDGRNVPADPSEVVEIDLH